MAYTAHSSKILLFCKKFTYFGAYYLVANSQSKPCISNVKLKFIINRNGRRWIKGCS